MSRETRLLLATGGAAVLALWLLARIRFDTPAVVNNPVTPVLAQLTGGMRYDALAADLADLQARVLSLVVVVDLTAADGSSRRVAGLRWRDDLVFVATPAGWAAPLRDGEAVRAVDRASGFAVVRVTSRASFPPTPWVPRGIGQPRYVVATDVQPEPGPSDASLHPVFVGALFPRESDVWPGTVWDVAAEIALRPGSFVFTTGGELVGLVAANGARRVIVPAATLLAEADRLLATTPRPAGALHVEVQGLTPPLAALTGASGGVIVTRVADGPASDALMVGDVVEAIDGRDLSSLLQWDARIARLESGDTIRLRVRRRGELHDTELRAAAASESPLAAGTLGLSLQRRGGAGSQVTAVEPSGAGARAGLRPGDVITLVGEIRTPTPQQIRRVFAALRPGERIMVAVTRGDAHSVSVLER